MKKERLEFLQFLYKTLKKHDAEILKYFCDASVSDNDYFFYGINSDIISNSLNILTNYLSGNIESAGVDASCRTIIEAMVILQMDAKGKITDNQKTIYRYLYSYVDIDNFYSVLPITNRDNELIKKLLSDKNKARQAMLEHFNCSRIDLKDRKIKIDDPCFYLKSHLYENIKFSKLLGIYPICNEKTIEMYELFSMFVHPRCEMNPEIDEAILIIRNIYVDYILDFVCDYIKHCKLLIDKKEKEKITSFEQDFFYNPLLSNNVKSIKSVEFVFDILMEKLCMLKNGTDWFTWYFLKKSKHILIDMMISSSLGYKEHVITLFKPFIEQYSVFFTIESINNLNDFNFTKQAFWYSSRIQLDVLFQKLGCNDTIVLEEEMKKLYYEFFKEKYNLDDYEKFYLNMRRNSLYCLTNGRKSYNKYVKGLIQSVFKNKNIGKDVMILYKIAKDMDHASGYNFNATEGILDSFSHKSILYSLELLRYFIINASETLGEHNEECNVDSIISFLNALITIENNALNEIYKYYEKC